MTWLAAMMALLVFMLMQRAGDGWPVHKLRTWAAMMWSSFLAWGAVMVPDATLMHVVLMFIAIDIVAGYIVMIRPAGHAQKAIGLCYMVMIFYHIGIAAASLYGPVFTDSYTAFLTATGWAQFAILTLWSGWDVGRACVHRLWPNRRQNTAEEIAGAN